ncbi:alpha/beta fold hydrolase [Maritimibacter dapengensis]|uniref:Alpha/beta hydrolase n=1 Tax=Maritimibacter dapengensis TaxID=2836868 RepID=A0ABS6SX00_9RHOB|nr:alpha/beta hydrolase [Maritimibacter dapengensis]MBV7377483.1 alpha/beta hydrolase [Maritimibacter dapengensis]
MNWTIPVVLLVVLLLFPWLREKTRDPVSKMRARHDAMPDPGVISAGLVKLSGGETWCQWHGKTSDSIIVLVHGLTTPSWVFAGLIRGLIMMGFQVLSYDLYGRGRSDTVSGAQTPQFHLRQLTDVLDHFGIEGPVTLLGYSMGGVIVSMFATKHPDRTDRVILLAPAGLAYTAPEPLRTAGNAWLPGNWLWSLLGAGALRRAARNDAAGPTVIVDIDSRMRAETARRGYLRAVLSSHRKTLLRDFEDVYRELGKTDVPVLAVWGENDAVIPPAAIGRLTLWTRHARHHVARNAGHGLPHTAPNEVISAISAFMRDSEARKRQTPEREHRGPT